MVNEQINRLKVELEILAEKHQELSVETNRKQKELLKYFDQLSNNDADYEFVQELSRKHCDDLLKVGLLYLALSKLNNSIDALQDLLCVDSE